jgi:hypothetical protein
MSCCTWANADSFVDIEQFLPDVLVKAPTVPEEIAANEIRAAAIEMAGRVPMLEREICQDIQAGVQDYFLDAPDGYAIRGVSAVTVQGLPVPLSTYSPFKTSRIWTGAFYHIPENRILLAPAPQQDGRGCLCVTVTLLPGQTSCALPIEFYEQHLDALASGALARLLLMKDASWADKASAGIYRAMFVAGIARASNTALRGGVTGPLVIRPKRFL